MDNSTQSIEEIATLLVYHRKVSDAQELNEDTSFLRGLASYARFIFILGNKEEEEKLLLAGYWKGILEGTAKRIEDLISKAENIEQKREVLPEVIELQKVVERAEKELKVLADG